MVSTTVNHVVNFNMDPRDSLLRQAHLCVDSPPAAVPRKDRRGVEEQNGGSPTRAGTRTVPSRVGLGTKGRGKGGTRELNRRPGNTRTKHRTEQANK